MKKHGRDTQLKSVLLSFVLLGSLLTPLPALAKTLEIGIEHTEVLPAVSQDLRPGKRFNLQAFEDQQQSNDWIKLPEWMTGTWKIGKETAMWRHDFKKNTTLDKPYTYNARHTFEYGMQQDRNGGIWHYIGVPYTSKTSLTEFDEIHLVNRKNFTKADAQAVSFTTVMTVVRVQMGHNITESFQQESITTYSPSQEEGFIELSASTKSFDANGQPWRQSDNVAKIKRFQPFKEVKTYHGKDMRESFREFLISTGQTNLLPD